MKALTLKQPWASFIVDGEKRVENRSWPPPAALIGQRIAIHAGMTWDGAIDFRKYSKDLSDLAVKLLSRGIEEGPFGVFLGTAVVHGTVRRPEHFNFAEPQMRWYCKGQVGWLLDDVRRLEFPIAYKGALGLWTVPPMIQAALENLPASEGSCWGRGR